VQTHVDGWFCPVRSSGIYPQYEVLAIPVQAQPSQVDPSLSPPYPPPKEVQAVVLRYRRQAVNCIWIEVRQGASFYGCLNEKKGNDKVVKYLVLYNT
jgi:hypothetical protein